MAARSDVGRSMLKGVPPFPKRPAYKGPPIPICLISTPKPYGRRCAIPPRPESRSRATLCSATGPLYAANRPAVIRRGVFHDTSACLFGHRSLGFPALAFSDHDVYGHVHGLRHLSGIPQAAPENVSLVGHDNIHRASRPSRSCRIATVVSLVTPQAVAGPQNSDGLRDSG